MRNWAAVVGKRVESKRPGAERTQKESKAQTGHNGRDTEKQDDTYNSLHQVPAKTATKRKLIEEALKSRANVATGERRCLGCGAAFRDLVRLAQHIADKHHGINAMVELPSNYRSSVLTLDQLNIRYVGKGTRLKGGSNKVSGGVVHREEKFVSKDKKKQSSLQAPEGTRAPRRRRPSRLKKGFRLAKAQEAVAHWLSVLESIEEAVQLQHEHLDTLQNEVDKLQGNNSLSVQVQLLNEQSRIGSEHIEQLLG